MSMSRKITIQLFAILSTSALVVAQQISDENSISEDSVDLIVNDSVQLSQETSSDTSLNPEVLTNIDTDMNGQAAKTDSLDKSFSRPEFDTIDASFLFTKKIKKVHEIISHGSSKARIQGYGGGAILQPMLLGFRTTSIYDLVHRDSHLKKFEFEELQNHKYQPMLVNGFWGFGGIGNGVRIGFGGWGGEYFISSNKTPTDSVMVLKIHNGFGGLLLEKACIHKNLNFIFGSIIGGGATKVTKSYQESNVFSDAAWQEDLENGAEAKARLAGIEFHSGVTMTAVSWFHIGLDLNGLFVLSVNGFGGSSNSFASFNPGFRLRLVLGNLG